MERNKGNLRGLWDDISASAKCSSIHVIWVPEGEEKQKGHNKIFEETITMFLTWERLVIQVQEAQRVPYRINPKRNNTKTHCN